MNPDTEQPGYHAQRVTKEQQARAERLVRAMCPDPDPVLQALGLIPTPRRTPPPPPPGVEVCKRGHPRTEANTRYRMKNGYRCRECMDCVKQRRKEPLDLDRYCRRGHQRTEANTYVGSDGGRRCKECQRNAERASRERRKQGR